MEWLNVLESQGTALLGPTVWMVLWTLIKIVIIAVPIIHIDATSDDYTDPERLATLTAQIATL